MRTYSQKTLRALQQCELIILQDFIEICEKNNLTYMGIGGTGIGALRHGGFIPWDDDIDVALLSKDLDKLIEIVQKEYSDKYTIINAKIDKNYPLATTRMMLKGTEFCEEALAHLPLDLGIFLDLYAFDNVADDEKLFRKQAWDAWYWSHVRMLLSIPNPVIIFHGFKGFVVRTASRCASAILRTFGPSKEKAYEKEAEARNRYKNCTTKRVAYMNDTDRFNEVYYVDDLFPVRKIKFEHLEVCFPKNLEETLVEIYGDYMQLPPKDKRKNHYPSRLDFGPYNFLLK